jgi:hypothetical protein
VAFTDNFNGAGSDTALESWTPSGGTAWTLVDGAASAALVKTGGDLKSNSATESFYQCDDQGDDNDQYVKAKLLNVTNGLSYLVCRAASSEEYVGLRGSGASVLVMQKRVEGSLSTMATGTTTVVSGDTIELRCVSTSYKAYINGVEELSVVDAFTPVGTRQGIVIGASVASSWIDDFEAAAVPAIGTGRCMFR